LQKILATYFILDNPLKWFQKPGNLSFFYQMAVGVIFTLCSLYLILNKDIYTKGMNKNTPLIFGILLGLYGVLKFYKAYQFKKNTFEQDINS